MIRQKMQDISSPTLTVWESGLGKWGDGGRRRNRKVYGGENEVGKRGAYVTRKRSKYLQPGSAPRSTPGPQ
jgi:hypothetical protein